MNLDRVASFADWRSRARAKLPRVLFDYIDGGSYAEATVAANARDFDALTIEQRVLRDMSSIDTAGSLVGQPAKLPIGLGPVGFAGMYSRRGEVGAARAAESAGVPFCLSTLGVCSIEEVSAAAVPPWFQLYMTKDRGFMGELIDRARAADCPVLIFTVDLPTPGARYRDWRSGMAAQQGLAGRFRQGLDGATHPGWSWDVYARGRPHSFGNLSSVLPSSASFADAWDWIRANFDKSVTWHDLDFIRRHWNGPIVIKGILHPDDAIEAVRWGADAIVVSNHGGRQLDGAASTISALPAIVDAVGSSTDILLDGGVRSGLDVLKALRLGAAGCLLGKAWGFALAGAGQAGVERMLSIMREELETAMILSGIHTVQRRARGAPARVGEHDDRC